MVKELTWKEQLVAHKTISLPWVHSDSQFSKFEPIEFWVLRKRDKFDQGYIYLSRMDTAITY